MSEQTELAKWIEALRPFATYAAQMEKAWGQSDDSAFYGVKRAGAYQITYGDFRRAARAFQNMSDPLPELGDARRISSLDGARTLPEAEQEIILLAERIESLMREKVAMGRALEEAERFMDYFAEGRTDFAGPGTPKSCLAMIRGALALKKPAATGETGK